MLELLFFFRIRNPFFLELYFESQYSILFTSRVWDFCPRSSFSFPFSLFFIFYLRILLKIWAWAQALLRLNPFFFLPLTLYLKREKGQGISHREWINLRCPLTVSITRMKKKGMLTHPGKNDWFLSIDPLKIRTTKYLVPVPRRDMFLDLALKILLLFSLFLYCNTYYLYIVTHNHIIIHI